MTVGRAQLGRLGGGGGRLAGGGGLAEALAPRDGLPALVAEGALLDRLGIGPGARLRLGEREFVVADRLTREPDAALSGMSFGPRVILRLADLEGSGLLAPGSLYNSAYRLRLAPGTDLAALRTQAVELFEPAGLRWSDRRTGGPGTWRFVDRLGSFLVLMGLAGLAVGGVGVSAAVRAYLDGKTETIATLKTLGASGGTIFAVYLTLIGALAALGVAIGLVLGAALPLLAAPLVEGRLPVPIEIGLYPRPLAEAAGYGLLTALIFALWPLARARDVRAASLFRGWAGGGRRLPRPAYLAALAALAAGFVALAAGLSAQPEIALAMAVGVAGALAALWLAAAGFRRLADAGGAGGSAVRAARPAAVGRTDQLSGPGRRAVAGNLSGALSAHGYHHQPRQRPAEPRGGPYPASREPQAGALYRRL